MNLPAPPEEGQVLTGPQFSEPMRVVTAAGKNPARKPWVEVRKVRHYYLDVEKLSAASDERNDR